jgi:hypothetical protein
MANVTRLAVPTLIWVILLTKGMTDYAERMNSESTESASRLGPLLSVTAGRMMCPGLMVTVALSRRSLHTLRHHH